MEIKTGSQRLPEEYNYVAGNYAYFMMEVMARLDCIDKLQGLVEKGHLKTFEAFDLAYLELRMACETIALSCLAIHIEDITERLAKIENARKPGLLFKELERMHSKFYPEPLGALVDESGRPARLKSLDMNAKLAPIPLAGDFLTRAKLVELHGKCGDHLHAGSPKRLIGGINRDKSTEPIRIAMNQITNLLNIHRICLVNNDAFVIVVMRPEPGANPLMFMASPASDPHTR